MTLPTPRPRSSQPKRTVSIIGTGSYVPEKVLTNADEYGGMPLLGVNGVCIIAHGGSSPVAVKNAIRMAVQSIRHQVNPHIIEEARRFHESATQPA